MPTFYYSIQSFPLHLSTFPKLFAFKRKEKNHNIKPLCLAGGLGSGEAGDISLTRSTEEYITFEIKLPSVQMTTLAMLGLIYHIVYGRIPVPFSLQLRYCCNQLGSLPCVAWALLTAKKLQGRGENLEPVKFISFVFQGMLKLNSLPF